MFVWRQESDGAARRNILVVVLGSQFETSHRTVKTWQSVLPQPLTTALLIKQWLVTLIFTGVSSPSLGYRQWTQVITQNIFHLPSSNSFLIRSWWSAVTHHSNTSWWIFSLSLSPQIFMCLPDSRRNIYYNFIVLSEQAAKLWVGIVAITQVSRWSFKFQVSFLESEQSAMSSIPFCNLSSPALNLQPWIWSILSEFLLSWCWLKQAGSKLLCVTARSCMEDIIERSMESLSGDHCVKSG